MKKYNHQKIEKKWQKAWDKFGIYNADDTSKKPKWYSLVEFPYPSGSGLHVGHIRSNTAMDIVSRKRRMQGHNVLYPMGWDAFGLPTENYAIKTGISPQAATKKNTDTFRKQLRAMGFSFDWSREIDTTDPKYYKWTQWMFLQFYKHGLAYKAKAEINWCPKDKIGLANEEVENGKCERCGGAVEKRLKEQWMLKMTAYAEKLLGGLKDLDFIPEVRTQQENWIGKSEGAEIEFPVVGSKGKIKVFTTRIDTIFSGTFLVIAPEHPRLAKALEDQDSFLKNKNEVKAYIESVRNKSELERSAEGKEKTGVELKGLRVINPATQEEMPVWTSEFVIAHYGTGIVFADAHDSRDFAFAKKYNIPLKVSIQPTEGLDFEKIKNLEECYEGEGILCNSEQFNGMTSAKARPKIIAWLAEKGLATPKTSYKLRDWVFSRQRYWGEPIPLIHCDNCAKKPKILLIHGLSGSNQENWFPWFKRTLEARGYDVITPNLPNAQHFILNDWLTVLEHSGIEAGDRLSVVGHSLGGPTACQFIRTYKLKVENLVLVAPTGKSQGPEQWKNLSAKGVSQEHLLVIQEFNDQNKDLAKVAKLTKKTTIYLSDNDPYIPVEVQGDYKTLKPTVKLLSNKGHFNATAGITEFPEILAEFPVVADAGWIPVPEKNLPVKLPKVEKYQPTDTGESPLSKVEKWVNVKCPNCKGPAKRETDTMPNWAGSSWYYLAYLMSKKAFNGPVSTENWKLEIENLRNWLPVDWYNGGMEHATRHLLYARFWNQFFHDIGEVPMSEPFKKRTAHGIILGNDGTKMSKSVGNVVNPDELIKEFGADALRLYEMFIGPFDQTVTWDPRGILGTSRFLEKVWRFAQRRFYENPDQDIPGAWDNMSRIVHKAIKKVSSDIERMSFNTAVSSLMTAVNEMTLTGGSTIKYEDWKSFLKILAPFAPFIAEELWEEMGNKESIHVTPWPEFDPKLLVEETFKLVIQVNGRVRATAEASQGISEADAQALALAHTDIKKWITSEVKKVIFVPNRLINLIF